MSTRVNLVLLMSLVLCALSLVNSQYQARRLFIELERAQSLSRQYEVQWTQLRLDQSTLAKSARIESHAAQELGMVPVSPERTQYLTKAGLK
jgi:cell division protein FtsL